MQTELCAFQCDLSFPLYVHKVTGANCLAISEQFVFCGCTNGTVRCVCVGGGEGRNAGALKLEEHWFTSISLLPLFSYCRLFDPYTLDYMTTLPKPHHLGVPIGKFDLGENAAVKKEGGERRSSFGAEDATKEYPDVVAVGIDTEQNRVHVLDIKTAVTVHGCVFLQ